MRTRRVILTTVLAGLMVVGVGALPGASANPQTDIKQVQQQVMDLQMKASAATEQANAAQAKLNGIESDLSAIQNRAARERSELGLVSATINDIARATYASGGMDPTLQVLMASNPSEFLAQAAVMGQIEQSQVDQLRHMQTARLRLAQTEAEISDRQAAAQQARDDMAAAQGDAASNLSAAQDVLSGLQEAERQRLIALQKQQRADEIAAAQAAARAAAQAQANNAGSSDSGGSTDNGGSSGATGAAESGGGFAGGSRTQVALQYALAQVGKPYVAAAAGPGAFDCSGLTMAAWAQAGVRLSHLSYSQFDEVQRIPESDLQPGDLVFYFGYGAHHVAMYVGNGKMVSASNPSAGVELIDYRGPWYNERFSGAGRVIG